MSVRRLPGSTPAFLLALLVLCLLPTRSSATSAAAPDTAAIVNGVLATEQPTTGALMEGTSLSSAKGVCSGTLIGCRTFVTAAHCVCDGTGASCVGSRAPRPSHYFVYLPHTGLHEVEGIEIHPDFRFPVGDVAVLRLAAPVEGVRPTRLLAGANPPVGTRGVIAGYGRTGGNRFDYGILRQGEVTIDLCAGSISDETSVCWRFRSPLGTSGTNSNTCNGDSGGPLFVSVDGEARLAGITSGGDSDSCLPLDRSYDASVARYHDWIVEKAGEPIDGKACGMLSPVGSPGSHRAFFSGSLNSGGTVARSFEVPSGTARLVVSANAVSDVDLFVRAGSPPATTTADCRRESFRPIEVCTFDNPTPGTWHALAKAFGSGAYQMTVTTFGHDCSEAPDGSPCDDGNPCTEGDACQSGSCSGLALPDGANCNDGNLCSHSDACLAGVCVGSVLPRTGCHGPSDGRTGYVQFTRKSGSVPTMAWRWPRGAATTPTDLGDPRQGTPYAVCVYDEAAGVPLLVAGQMIRPGGRCGTRDCWKATERGFVFADGKATQGLTRLEVRSGAAGKAWIGLNGRGGLAPFPTLPLQQDSAVVVQVTNGATCWEARYETHTRNTETGFKAKIVP